MSVEGLRDEGLGFRGIGRTLSAGAWLRTGGAGSFRVTCEGGRLGAVICGATRSSVKEPNRCL